MNRVSKTASIWFTVRQYSGWTPGQPLRRAHVATRDSREVHVRFLLRSSLSCRSLTVAMDERLTSYLLSIQSFANRLLILNLAPFSSRLCQTIMYTKYLNERSNSLFVIFPWFVGSTLISVWSLITSFIIVLLFISRPLSFSSCREPSRLSCPFRLDHHYVRSGPPRLSVYVILTPSNFTAIHLSSIVV